MEASVCGRASFNAEVAARVQKLMAGRLVLEGGPGHVEVVAGLDASYVRVGVGSEKMEVGLGAAVSLSYPSLTLGECVIVLAPVCVPYIPGLLAFRELPVMAPALSSLGEKPDLVMVDGHGISHPRGFGIASHVGLIFGKPAIGVAKRRLAGWERVLGGKTYVYAGGVAVGIVLETGRARLYVSPGHMIGLEEAAEWTMRMLRGRLPEPTRKADEIAKTARTLLQGYKPLTSGAGSLETCRVRASRRLKGLIPERVEAELGREYGIP